MNTIIFKSANDDNILRNAFEDWGLILKPRSIPKPKPKTNYVNIPGGDGTIDLSEVVSGEIKYDDMVLTFEFSVIDAMNTWDDKISEITNFLHGRKFKITQTSDEEYYYLGRCEINKFSSSKNIGNLVVNCTVGPYKFKQSQTVLTYDLTTTNTKNVIITNDRKSVIPTITCTKSTTITFKGKVFSLSAGTHTVLDIQFVEGNNSIKLQSTGKVTFAFQEGSL